MKWTGKPRSKKKAIDPKQMLRRAEREARKGKKEDALCLFTNLVDIYLGQGAGLKAIAVAKSARSILGPGPKTQGMLIKIYSNVGLRGDAEKEYREYSGQMAKDNIPVFSGMGYGEFADFMDIMEIIRTKKGNLIIKQGQSGEDIYIITEGEFEVIRDGKRVGMLKEGDLFGEIGFFRHRLRTASVRSVDSGEVVRLPSDQLRELCDKYPLVEQRLEELYTERVLKKAGEDLMLGHSLSNYQVSHLSIRKGDELPNFSDATVTVVKKGTIEINYDKGGLSVKRYMGPGSVFRFPGIRAQVKAASDVEIVQAEITFLEDPKDMP